MLPVDLPDGGGFLQQQNTPTSKEVKVTIQQ